MPTYVVLVDWTDQGIRNVKQTTERTDHGGEIAQKHGMKLEQAYWTVGAYDMVAVSFAKWGGAEVIASVGSEEQAEVALEAGAGHDLNYRTDDVVARVEEMDTEALAPLGTIAAYSSDAEAEPTLPFWPLLFKNATIRLVGSDDLPEAANRKAATDITTCLESGVLRPRIASRYPLARIAEAYEAVESGQSGGRVILGLNSLRPRISDNPVKTNFAEPLEVSGMFNDGDIICGLETRYLPRFGSAQQLELRFRALLTEDGGTKRLELRMS